MCLGGETTNYGETASLRSEESFRLAFFSSHSTVFGEVEISVISAFLEENLSIAESPIAGRKFPITSFGRTKCTFDPDLLFSGGQFFENGIVHVGNPDSHRRHRPRSVDDIDIQNDAFGFAVPWHSVRDTQYPQCHQPFGRFSMEVVLPFGFPFGLQILVDQWVGPIAAIFIAAFQRSCQIAKSANGSGFSTLSSAISKTGNDNIHSTTKSAFNMDHSPTGTVSTLLES